MYCEAYKQRLSDAAPSGELTAKLQEHLASCASCRATFAEEQSLYAAIDAGVGVAANAEVPSTLVPRVHVAINKEPVFVKPSRIWLLLPPALAAAALLAFLFLPHPAVRNPVQPNQAVSHPVVPMQASHPGEVNPPVPRGVIRTHDDGATRAARSHKNNAELVEVIVSPVEQTAFLRYETGLRQQSAARSLTLLARTVVVPQGIEPLEIAELEVGDLKIPALTKQEADADK